MLEKLCVDAPLPRVDAPTSENPGFTSGHDSILLWPRNLVSQGGLALYRGGSSILHNRGRKRGRDSEAAPLEMRHSYEQLGLQIWVVQFITPIGEPKFS